MLIRKAIKADLPEILNMIYELAEFERAKDEVSISLSELEEDGFGSNPIFEVLLAVEKESIMGMAFYFYSYSTWKGKCIYLEDIIIKNEYRSQGLGTQLFEAVIEKAKEMGVRRMQWQVLDWNEKAIDFYKKFDAQIDNSWLNGRLIESQIKNFSKVKISQ